MTVTLRWVEEPNEIDWDGYFERSKAILMDHATEVLTGKEDHRANEAKFKAGFIKRMSALIRSEDMECIEYSDEEEGPWILEFGKEVEEGVWENKKVLIKDIPSKRTIIDPEGSIAQAAFMKEFGFKALTTVCVPDSPAMIFFDYVKSMEDKAWKNIKITDVEAEGIKFKRITADFV